MTVNKTETIVLGGGCFWCLEAVLKTFAGIKSVTPGYAGGHISQPTYENVSSGTTGHAEVVKVDFDPAQISLDKVLEIFFTTHDPTTKDRQGNDIGFQYRSVILYTSPKQLEAIRRAVAKAQVLQAQPIVTEVKKLTKFWPAESYHCGYYDKNKNQPYCRLVIAPKLKKVKMEEGK
jgi:peptide-methionine (S)-S-oxide reductase